MWYCLHTVKPVGVGSPNPLGLENQAPTMDAVPPILPHLAPAEQHVLFV